MWGKCNTTAIWGQAVINPTNKRDELVPVTTARNELLPKRLNGKPFSRSTVWRWINRGVRGVKLGVVYVGDTPMLSQSLIQRFMEEVTAQRNAASGQRVLDASEAELEAAGLR